MNLIFAALVTVWAGWLIVKRYKAQTVLFMAGGVLLAGSVIMGYGSILPEGKGTGFMGFDLFELIRSLFSNRVAGLGLNIMAVGGFARFMDKIGASNALVNLTITPLLKLKSPYIVMSACWVLGMFLGLAINSASGLAMLLMVTMFPILVALGVSRIAATAAIATTLCLDWSPADTGTILAAEICGLNPVVYWHTYQIPIACLVIPVVAVVHYFTQKIMDKRDGHVVRPMRSEDVAVHAENAAEKEAMTSHPPKIFAILPVIPLALILIFSPLCIPSVKMNIIMAMNLGADDFIAKPFDQSVLMAKIQALLRRTYDFGASAPVLEHRGALLNTGDNTLTYQGQRVSLTKNEYRILLCLMQSKGRVVSQEKLMERLWETDSFVDENTLTVNIGRLRKKLDAAGLPGFITTRVGLGYMVG